nr:SNF2 helicase associated domain-containing protein [uncultured Anaerobutyricum sp.]
MVFCKKEELQGCFTNFDEENPKLFCQGEEAVYKLISEGIGEIQKIAEVFADEKLKKIQFLKPPKVSIGVSVSGELLEMNLKIPDMSREEVYDILSAYQKKTNNGNIL